jgi:hypothetical protein
LQGYRVIARKDGEWVRLWARTRSDYSNAFTLEGCSTGKWVGMMSTLKGRIEAAESKAGIRRKDTRINLFFIEGWPEDGASEFLKRQDTISADRTESSASFRRTMESRWLLR